MIERLKAPEQGDVLRKFTEHPFANLETYKYFNQKGEQAATAKSIFLEAALSGSTPDAPNFIYPDINIDEIATRRDELTDILNAALALDMSDEANRLVREKVTERLHETGLLILTKLQSELSRDDPNYAAVSYQLGENLREVYGVPEVSHWQGILGYRLSLLSAVEEHSDVPDSIQSAWEFIRESLPNDLPIEKPYQPKPETLQWYAEQLKSRTALGQSLVNTALEHGELALNNEGQLDAPTIMAAAKLVLLARGIEGWDVQLTDEANVDTSQEKQTIFIPKNRFMTLGQFDAIIGSHEIDEHVARRDNGDKTGVPILGGSGCAGYLAWEEGNGKANEALLKGAVSNEESAFNFYLSGGLALGLDGMTDNGRNFGQTFDLVWRMRYVAAFLQGKLTGDSIDDQRAIMDKTVNSLNRIFRGTDGTNPGVVFTKDVMTYYLGQTEVWKKWDTDMQLSEAERIAEHNLERSAKIDPLRADHRRVASNATL